MDAIANNQETVGKMKLTSDLSQSLIRIQSVFGDLEPLIAKNLTPSGFWFIVDTIHFQMVNRDSLQNTRESIVNNCEVDINEFSESQGHEFVLKIRKLISNQKGTLNISDILSTPIDEAIEAAEQEQARIRMGNDERVREITEKIQNQNKKMEKIMNKLAVPVRQSHPMFAFDELEESICLKWMEEEEKKKQAQKCYICYKSNRLVSCKSCDFKVHEDCYPAFPHKTVSKQQSKQNNELEMKEAIANFTCQNCRNQIDSQNQTCCLCCCVGGSFLKTCQFEPNMSISLENDQNFQTGNSKTNAHLNFVIKAKPMRKPKFVHVSCFLWNGEAKWNSNIGMVENIGKIDRKKMNGMCSLCGVTYGAAVPCSNQSCRRFYHAECARRNRLEMNFYRAKTSVVQLFCERHRHLSKSQAIFDKQANRMRDVRKLFDGIDKEIKRQHSCSTLPQMKSFAQKDGCTACGREEAFEKTTMCKQCRKWHHNSCSTFCQNCLL